MTEQRNLGSDKEKLLPDLEDFSTAAIRKAVRNESLFHPLTLYPMAFGTLSGMAAMLYDLPLLLAGMGGLMALGAATSIVNFFFRDDVISRNYLDSLHKSFARRREQVLKTLGRDLEECRLIPGAEQYADQGVKQFAGIEKKYKKLNRLLNQKFNAGELTHGSYLGAAEQVYFSVLDNLLRIVSLLQGVSTIDPAYILHRRQELEKIKAVVKADEREFETLKKREELRGRQLQQVNGLLTANEESMTAMDETSAAIAALQTGSRMAKVDMDTAMAYLQELAGRVASYDRQDEQVEDLIKKNSTDGI